MLKYILRIKPNVVYQKKSVLPMNSYSVIKILRG